MSLIIQNATAADIPALTDIYNFYVEEGAVTFDTQIKTVEQRLDWFAQFDTAGAHQLIIAQDQGRVIGYAGSSRFREKPAYATSVETTIYLDPQVKHSGVGTILYQALFAAISHADINRAYAGITQPNEASVALHQKFGFTPIGTYSQVGRKFGKYWDVQWFEKPLN